MNNDRDILIAALTPAVELYKQQVKDASLLGADATKPEIHDPIVAAIEQCEVYKSVAGQVIYSAGSGPVIQAAIFAVPLLYKAERDITAAADWLIRLLSTRKAKGFLKAAIWGLSIDKEVRLSKTATLMPFEKLPTSDMKDKVSERAKETWNGSVWMAKNYHGAPGVGFVCEMDDFPYLGKTTAPFDRFDEELAQARELWSILEGIVAGQPLAIGFWFEYEDKTLDISAWENSISWSLPEIPPHIKKVVAVQANALEETLGKFGALPEDMQADLSRSMQRFTLSQCRYQFIDRILDLALAYEIPFSGGEYAPIGWKVSLRSAQLIGGDLEKRKENRRKINEVFALRNKGTHGSSLKDFPHEQLEKMLEEASDIYRVLMQAFLRLGAEPDWKSLELEPIFKEAP